MASGKGQHDLITRWLLPAQGGCMKGNKFRKRGAKEAKQEKTKATSPSSDCTPKKHKEKFLLKVR